MRELIKEIVVFGPFDNGNNGYDKQNLMQMLDSTSLDLISNNIIEIFRFGKLRLAKITNPPPWPLKFALN